jgi:predicted lipid-binding transport protein (Tim44 family)
MKRTPQEIVELVVFGLIALLIGTGVLWLLGALFGLVGQVLGWLAALLWGLLSFLVPVALVAGAVVLIVRWAQGRPNSARPAPAAGAPAAPAPADSAPADAPVDTAAPASAVAAADEVSLDRERAAEATAEGMPPAPAGTPAVAPGHPTDGVDAGPSPDEPPRRDV